MSTGEQIVIFLKFRPNSTNLAESRNFGPNPTEHNPTQSNPWMDPIHGHLCLELWTNFV